MVANEAQVVMGAGGRAVGEVGGKQRRPVVGDDHDVVLRHVDGRGELKVTWEEGKKTDWVLILTTFTDFPRVSENKRQDRKILEMCR